MTDKPVRPVDLRARGRRLFDAVIAGWDLGPDDLALLVEAARTLDETERLRAACTDAPLTTVGSTGQVVAHPLLEQLRKHRALLAKLLAELALPADVDDIPLNPRQRHAQVAGQARWRRAAAAKAERSARYGNP